MISIITPSFNQGQYLEKNILSIINQSNVKLEHIIVDNESKDSTQFVIEKYHKSLQKVIIEKDNGQTHAINKGLSIAQGNILAYLNADDYYEPNALEKIDQFFYLNPEVDLVYTDVINHYSNKTQIIKHFNSYNEELFFTKVCLHQPGVFWRRKVTENLGLLNTNLYYTMDYEYWLRMKIHGYRMKYLSIPTANFLIHHESKTFGNPIKMYEEKIHLLTALYYQMPHYNVSPTILEILKFFDRYDHQWCIQDLETIRIPDFTGKLVEEISNFAWKTRNKYLFIACLEYFKESRTADFRNVIKAMYLNFRKWK